MKIGTDRIETLIDQCPVARLATSGKHGAIHLVPIVYVRIAGLLWSPVDGKPKSGTELLRVRNIRNNDRVTVLLDEYSADWSKLWWIRLEGRAEIIQLPAENKTVADAVAALKQKYPQYRTVPVLREPPTFITIRPVRVSSWCAGDSIA